MSTGNPLTEIPTDQLVLKLLQELASRVEKLERKHEAEQAQGSPAAAVLPGGVAETSSITTGQQQMDEAVSKEEDGDEANDEYPCLTCGKEPGDDDPCRCIEIPYGHVIDIEKVAPEDRMSIEARIEFSDPALVPLLEEIPWAGVPADGRLKFRNFWASRSPKVLEDALEVLDDMRRNHGFFTIIDFGADETSFNYGRGPRSAIAKIRRRDGPGLVLPAQIPMFRLNPRDVDCSLARWNRLIIIAGFRRWEMGKVPFFNFEYFGHVYDAAKAHVHPEESLGEIERGYNMVPATSSHLFHLVWYGARRSTFTRGLSKHTSWKRGKLHDQTGFELFQLAHTVQASCDDRSRFWSMLVLLPVTSKSQNMKEHIRVDASKSPLLVILMAKAILLALESAWEGWTSLADYVDGLLGTGGEIFDLEDHDTLIFDDDLYTRSRIYFWVINCLNDSENRLRRNIQAWTGYRTGLMVECQRQVKPDSAELKEFDDAVQKCDEMQAKLEKIMEQFNEQRNKAIALRDGLFSASAVMESRASTRLGENVKLLTYVSIFYLPLAFCTSIWSTSPAFGYRNLIYTTLAIGLLTYLVVFNLNLLVSSSKFLYASLKSSILSSMQNDSRHEWQDRGELFHRYRPRRNADEPKPSEWWVLVYLLQRVWDVLLFRRRGRREEGVGKKRGWFASLWSRGDGKEKEAPKEEGIGGQA